MSFAQWDMHVTLFFRKKESQVVWLITICCGEFGKQLVFRIAALRRASGKTDHCVSQISGTLHVEAVWEPEPVQAISVKADAPAREFIPSASMLALKRSACGGAGTFE